MHGARLCQNQGSKFQTETEISLSFESTWTSPFSQIRNEFGHFFNSFFIFMSLVKLFQFFENSKIFRNQNYQNLSTIGTIFYAIIHQQQSYILHTLHWSVRIVSLKSNVPYHSHFSSRTISTRWCELVLGYVFVVVHVQALLEATESIDGDESHAQFQCAVSRCKIWSNSKEK